MSRYIRYKYQKQQINFLNCDDLNEWIDTCQTRIVGFDSICQTSSCNCKEYGTDEYEPIYQYKKLNPNYNYECLDGNRHYRLLKQVSYDNGVSWVDTTEYEIGDVYETNSPWCNANEILMDWFEREKICEGTTQYSIEVKRVSLDGGASWTDMGYTDENGVTTYEERKTLIETNSTECGGGESTDSGSTSGCTASTTYSNFATKSITLDDGTVVTPTNDYYYLNKTVAWNEVYDGVASVSYTKDKTVINADCTSATTTETFTTTNFTYDYSPSGNNETTEDREVFANMFENGTSFIGRIYYTQEGKIEDSGETNCTSSTTSTYCDGYNLYQQTTYYVDALCNGNYVQSGSPVNTLIETNSTECGYEEPTDSGSTSGDLIYEFSGDTSIYIINGNLYTATTSPYSATVSNFTDATEMFKYTNITKLISMPDTSNVVYMNNMFQNCSALTSLDVSSFDTSKVTNMDDMFNWCRKLTTLDLSNFNTSNVTSMSNMFYGVTLTSLDLSNFDTSNVAYMNNMFNYCNYLTSLDLSSFDTSKVINMSNMFNACQRLTELNLSNWDISNVTVYSGMFSNCIRLTSLILGFVTQEQYDWWCARLTDASISCDIIQYNIKAGGGSTTVE